MHVIDVLWRRKKEGFISGLLSWEESLEEPVFHQLQAGDEIRWTIKGPRICVGSRSDSGLLRCPEIVLLGKRRKRCVDCSTQDRFNACIRCDGHSCLASDDRRMKCENAVYVVYIAIFGDGISKIGVSSKERVLTRWVEQGADFAGVVKTVTGGKKARLIEDRASRIGGLRKIVRTSRKMESMEVQLTMEKARELIVSLITPVEEILQIPSDIVDLSSYYSLRRMDAKPQRWNESSKSIDGLQLLGEVVGIKGALLVTKLAGGFRMINLNDLVGYSIKTGTKVSVVTQSGLSDFF